MRVWAPLVQTKTGAVSGNGLGDHRDSPSVALGFSPPTIVPGKSQLGRTKMRRLVETGAAGNPCPETLVLEGPPGPRTWIGRSEGCIVHRGEAVSCWPPRLGQEAGARPGRGVVHGSLRRLEVRRDPGNGADHLLVRLCADARHPWRAVGRGQDAPVAGEQGEHLAQLWTRPPSVAAVPVVPLERRAPELR